MHLPIQILISESERENKAEKLEKRKQEKESGPKSLKQQYLAVIQPFIESSSDADYDTSEDNEDNDLSDILKALAPLIKENEEKEKKGKKKDDDNDDDYIDDDERQ